MVRPHQRLEKGQLAGAQLFCFQSIVLCCACVQMLPSVACSVFVQRPASSNSCHDTCMDPTLSALQSCTPRIRPVFPCPLQGLDDVYTGGRQEDKLALDVEVGGCCAKLANLP